MAELARGVVGVLAFIGGAALVVRLLRASFRLALSAAEASTAAGLADISARRGDLTGMMERRAAESDARRLRRTALASTALWIVWLVIPVYAGWVREAYALAAVLWLAPGAGSAHRRPRANSAGPPEHGS
jgi:hypothetical protein